MTSPYDSLEAWISHRAQSPDDALKIAQLLDAHDAVALAEMKEKQTRWVSVKDELPLVEGTYVAKSHRFDQCGLAWFDPKDKFTSDITHWLKEVPDLKELEQEK